ncbi:MAG: hypothetical protein LDL41_11975 [Coleofasciculus sp. S288]|nr:hypothetical protein [Coleofasciculus sp. S288]
MLPTGLLKSFVSGGKRDKRAVDSIHFLMTRLFKLVARPLATAQTEGAFLGGLRLMAIDGTVFDVPDTEAEWH